ncbi:MAG: conserved phage C-terminal domain-containing protein, partial [Gammaproteobacteria bacterium]|nr:conserved phage C-terminal domain-containing protein [Gammaproteobacteria bacterium]
REKEGKGKGKELLSGKPDTAEKTEIIILEKLNLLTGKNFKPVESNLKLIRARLSENHTSSEMLDVVAMKVERWHGGKMDEYLRPATLFNAEKFNQYVGELPDWRREQSGSAFWMDERESSCIDGELVHG